VRSKRATSKVV